MKENNIMIIIERSVWIKSSKERKVDVERPPVRDNEILSIPHLAVSLVIRPIQTGISVSAFSK